MSSSSVVGLVFSGDGGGCDEEGPVGVPTDAGAVPLRRRQTNLTPWNLESWNLPIAAAHVASDL